METSLASAGFFTIGRGEQIIGEYEVFHRRRGFTPGDFVIMLVLFVVLAVTVVFAIIAPLAYAVYVMYFRTAVQGWLIVTTERLGYYARGRNGVGEDHLLFQVHLDNIVGITTEYNQSYRSESVIIEILTSYQDGFTIGAEQKQATSWRGRVVSGKTGTTIGKDTFRVLPVLYGLVDQARARKAA